MNAIASIDHYRQAAFDGAPRRLHRIVAYGRACGLAAVPAWDAQEYLENAIWANGALPADRPSRLRAWRLTLDRANEAYMDAALEGLARVAAEAIAEYGPGYHAAYVTTWKTCSLASDDEIAAATNIIAGTPWCPIRRARRAHSEGDRSEYNSIQREAHIDRIEQVIEPAMRALGIDTGSGQPETGELSVSMVGDEEGLGVFISAHEHNEARSLHRDAIHEAIVLDRRERIALWEAQDAAGPRMATVDGKRVPAADAGPREPLTFNAGKRVPQPAPASQAHPYDQMSPEQLRRLARARETGIASTADRTMDAADEARADAGPSVELASGEGIEALTSPPGLVGELIDWMESSSDRPNRALLLGAALTLVGTIAGRRFASPTNLRTNSYIVTLAPSGHGKDHALSQTKLLVEAAGLDRFVGPARIMSASALRRLIKREPAVACFIDEFGGFMHQIHDKRGGLHNTMIRNDMMEVFSSAGSFFAGSEYANEEAIKIYAPNFSVSGTSTPAQFWASLTSMSSVDGLLARMIVIDVAGAKPARRTPPVNRRDVPSSLVTALHQLADAGSTSGNLAKIRGGAPEPHVAPLDADGEDVLARFTAELDATEGTADEEALPFINRAREHAIKLALTVAIGVDPAAPVIDGAVMDWACRLARLSMSTLIRESADRIADNDRAAAVNRVYGLIKSAGKEGITEGRIGNRAKGIDARMRSQILNDLQMGGKVVFLKVAGTGGRPSERYFIC